MAGRTDGSSDKPSDLRPPAGWAFWVRWVLACSVGWAVAGPVSRAVGSSADIIVAGYAGVAAGGIVVGVLQWLVLRRHVAGAGWWVPANILSAAMVGVVVLVVGLVSADVGWVVGAGLFGTALGVLQWLVLRPQVARAGWWVLATTVGWVVGGPLGGLLGWAALGVVYGAITGGALVRLLREPPPGSDLASAVPS